MGPSVTPPSPLCPAGAGAVAVPRAGLKKLALPPDYSGERKAVAVAGPLPGLSPERSR